MNERLNLTETDFEYAEHGTLVTLHPRNDAASEWVQEHLYDDQGNGPMKWGDGYVIEPRYFGDIFEGLQEDGFLVRPSR